MGKFKHSTKNKANERMRKKKKLTIILSSVAVGLALIVLAFLMLAGYYATMGPFSKLGDTRFGKLEGNGEDYAIENVQPVSDSPLDKMNICYLGSSVTYGNSSLQTSFPEYIAKRNNTTFVKEAVSGTTLVNSGFGGSSYIKRMKNLDKNAEFDLFICQLSTNDATQNKPLGTTDSTDDETICGAINSIINYVNETWDCPVIFYTNAYYDNEAYLAMVTAVKEIATVKNIGVIDMYTDAEFNNITSEQHSLYMADEIHPTKAGYLEWWTPKMEEYLYDFISN